MEAIFYIHSGGIGCLQFVVSYCRRCIMYNAWLHSPSEAKGNPYSFTILSK